MKGGIEIKIQFFLRIFARETHYTVDVPAMLKTLAEPIIGDLPLYAYIALSLWFTIRFFRQRLKEQAEWRIQVERLESRLGGRLDEIVELLDRGEPRGAKAVTSSAER